METQDYLNLIPSANSEQPNFVAMVALNAGYYAYLQALFSSMIPIFDLDTPPVGDQLDIIGQWVGITRNIAVPLSGVYFTWDDVQADGWDYGSWQPSTTPTQMTSLPDDAYLNLIRAKIAANQWDGTTEGAYAIWSQVFPALEILIQDYANLSYALVIDGSSVDSVTLALITGGYIPLRPEGILVAAYFISYDSNPIFAWDLDTSFMGGWDTSSWAIESVPA